jgi:hypothetical protein
MSVAPMAQLNRILAWSSMNVMLTVVGRFDRQTGIETATTVIQA